MMFARFAALGALCSALAWAQTQPPLTTIQDVLFKADGTRFNGLINIQWTSFEGGNQTNIPQQMTTVRIVDGNLFVQLVPTTDAVPAAVYTVKYSSDGKIQFIEFWAVPPSSAALRVRDVRTTDPQFPSGGAAGGLTGPILLSDVSGLVQELNSRPIKGPGYSNSRAAVINNTGLVEGAAGSLSDCVRVDGTAGPCGSSGGAVFVDSEVPTGAVNGSNSTFSLVSTPQPSSSLALYRNGLLQRAGAGNDYTISGSTITFLSGATPQTGDLLLAFYRPSSGTSVVFVDNEIPSGTIDGSNATFTLTATPSPGLSLELFRNGALQKAGVDYTLTGASIQFQSGSIPQTGSTLRAFYRH
jgi:hypothetical protein